MYFSSRLQAGRMLAAQLAPKYRGQKCTVVALDDGGVMVGAQIAVQLHCPLTLLMSSEIMLPREPEAIAGIVPEGAVEYNHQYSPGEIDELVGEYYGYIEQEKTMLMHQMNRLIGKGGTLNRELLVKHNVILVSEGLRTGFPVDLAAAFLKPIEIQKLVVAVPFASLSAVDRMHILADDLYCLDVIADYINTDHYYDKRDVPDHNTIIETLEDTIMKWR